MKHDAIGDLLQLEYMAQQCRLSVIEQQGRRHNLIRALIDWRLESRKNKDFVTSDKIRDILNSQGVVIKDSNLGFGDCITDTYVES
jgi:cysteinyl-tRNA synthetase